MDGKNTGHAQKNISQNLFWNESFLVVTLRTFTLHNIIIPLEIQLIASPPIRSGRINRIFTYKGDFGDEM